MVEALFHFLFTLIIKIMRDLNIPIRDSLMSHIEPYQVDLIIDFLKLHRDNNRKILFLIDPDIIRNYCFPKGINDKPRQNFLELSNEYIYDEQLTLFNLFSNNLTNIEIFTISKYIYELKGILADCNLSKNNSNKIINREDTINFDNEFVENNFSKYIGEILLTQEPIEKLRHVLAESSMSISENDLKNVNVKKCFEHLQKFIKELTNEIKLIYKNKETLNYNENSRDNDSYAIASMLLINQIQYSKEKIFFITNEGDVNYHVFESKKCLNSVITLPMYFLILITKVNDKNGNLNYKNSIALLEEIKKKVSFFKDFGHSFRDSFDSQYFKLFEGYVKLRNNFENLGLYHSMKELSESKDINLVKTTISNILRKITSNQQDYKKLESILDKLESEYILSTSYANFINQLEKKDGKIKVTQGNDVVESKYQILPIFLFFGKSSKYQLLINHICHIILGIKKSFLTSEEIYNLVLDLKSVKPDSDNCEGIIMKLYLFLIIPFENVDNQNSNDKDIIEWIDVIRKNHEKFNDKLLIEFYYLGAWVYRRAKKYNESRILLELGLEKTEYSDARFFHGLFLLDYCELNLKNTKINGVRKILLNCELAFENYSKLLEKNSQNSYIAYYEKIQEVFSNNFAYFYALISYHFYRNNRIEDGRTSSKLSRNKINSLKTILKNNNNETKNVEFNFHKYPEYRATESYVEYVESFYINDEEKFKKLNHARREIVDALQLITNRNQISRYNKIKSGIENEWLKHKLLKLFSIVEINKETIKGIISSQKISDFNSSEVVQICDLILKDKTPELKLVSKIYEETGIDAMI